MSSKKKDGAKKDPTVELLKAADEARAAGLSYGQYQARRYMQKMKDEQREPLEKQADYIRVACEQCGLSSHITWLSDISPKTISAENIARAIAMKKEFPAKVSFMFCDGLDMCFFFDSVGKARVTFSGQAEQGSDDLTKIADAFKVAKKLLKKMQSLYDKGEK